MKCRNFMLFIYLTIFIFLNNLSCTSGPKPAIRDIIQPVSLIAGITDTLIIGDLFFADQYNLQFRPHPHIMVEFNQGEGLLILKADSSAAGLFLINFKLSGADYVLPVKVKKQFFTTFSYTPKNPANRINLFGSFNSWNRDELQLQDLNNDGTYEITIPLEPGRYEYKFYVDGKELLDNRNPDKVSNPFGDFNSLLTIKSEQSQPVFLHLLESFSDSRKSYFKFFYEGATSDLALQKEEIFVLLDNHRLASETIKFSSDTISIDLDNAILQGKRLLRFAVSRNKAFTYFHEIPVQLVHQNKKQSSEFIWKDAIIYAIMVDRFFDGDESNTKPVKQKGLLPQANFHGGDLQGILEKLEEGYFEDLGINVLWLSPIIQNTFGSFREYPEPHRYFTGYHGYWPIDHEKVDVRFGDMELFKKLVQEAHKKGIKVILDFVANHVHQEHIFFQKHPEWFGTLDLPDGRKNIRLWDEQRLTTWFDTFLPSFDFQGSAEALEVMTDNAVWWVKETGIDGFRQDAVKHIPNNFWRILTYKLKKEIELKENRQIYQIGETFGGYGLISSYVNNGQLNAQFNFNLYDVALSTFLDPEISFETLNDEMHRTFDVYGVNHLMGNIMDSHDKVRFLAYADGDISFSNQGNATEIGWNDPPQVDNPDSYRKAQLYQAYLLTIPGLPVIYYGDEIGMTGAADPDNRRPMRFGDKVSEYEKEMNRVVKKLVGIRREHPALRYGDFLPLHVDKDSYIFMRSTINERILVALNKSDQSQKISLNLPELYNIAGAVNLLNAEKTSINNSRILVDIEGMGWKIYILSSEKSLN